MSKYQSFWFGDSLPPYQRLAMKSFIDHGHEYVLYAYKEFDIPAGATLRDAAEVLPQSRVFVYDEGAGVGRGSVSVFANLFRYHLLYRMGDWWVDADVICLSDDLPSTPIFMGWEYEHVIGNAILRFPAEHAFVGELRDAAEIAGTSGLDFGATGPQLLTRLAWERKLLDLVTPQPRAYPVQSVDALHLLMPEHRDELEERLRHKPFLHIWNEVQRRAVIFPWMTPPPGSLMAELFRRHGIDFANAPVYTADQIRRLSDNYQAGATWSHPVAHKAEVARLESELSRARARAAALEEELAQLRRLP
jgi:hypothetical protein